MTSMKKVFLFIGIICSLFICSCIEYEYKEVDGKKIQILKSNIDMDIKYVEFDGHEYVYVDAGHGKSLCHSPKCKCLTEYKK